MAAASWQGESRRWLELAWFDGRGRRGGGLVVGGAGAWAAVAPRVLRGTDPIENYELDRNRRIQGIPEAGHLLPPGAFPRFNVSPGARPSTANTNRRRHASPRTARSPPVRRHPGTAACPTAPLRRTPPGATDAPQFTEMKGRLPGLSSGSTRHPKSFPKAPQSPQRRCPSTPGQEVFRLERRAPIEADQLLRYMLMPLRVLCHLHLLRGAILVSTFKYKLSSRSGPITIEDYRELAQRAVPDMIWAFVDFGSEDLATLTANRSAFSQYMFKTKVLTGKETTDLSVQVGNQTLSLPVLLAPTGLVGLSHWTGERGAAQAAERAGTLSIVSTAASYSFEEVAEGTESNHFFQLYPWADLNTGRHDLTLSLIERAQRSGYKAMFVTVDVPALGNRESERKRGMGDPPIITPARILNAAFKPKWWAAFLRHRRMSSRNFVDTGGAKAAITSLRTQYRMMRPELDWNDFAWMREHWEGPLYLKGVLDADDAERAVALGADGVVVSNHGGRQLDGAVASLDALPAIAARVGDRAEVLLDGGIRRGSDVVKALCLGASAVCIGRPYLYGMCAAGPDGAEHVINILREEIATTMTLMGVGGIEELEPTLLVPANTPLPKL